MNYTIDAPEGLFINLTILMVELENGCSTDYLLIYNVAEVYGTNEDVESLKGTSSTL